MFAPGTLPIGSNVAAWVFAIALLATPVVVFADTVALSQRHDRSYKLRWLIWPIGAVMLGPFTLLAYLLLRS
jgi:hypothetical protein